MPGHSLSPHQAPPRPWAAPFAGAQRRGDVAATGASAIYWAYVVLIIFNVGSPKAGIEVGGLPLTFGYILLAAAAPLGVIGLVRRPTLQAAAIGNFIAYLLVGLIAIYKTLVFGAQLQAVLVGLALFIALPAIMLIGLCAHLEYLSERQIGGILKWCMRFVIAWGIMNFVLFALFHWIVEIKYVTINAGEVSSVFNKNNRRGSLMKLISTYNNGNIFGVCMIMLAPVYIYFEKSRAWVVAFIGAIVLSLSRTTWFGLIAVGGLMVLTGQIRLSRGYFWIALVSAVALAIVMMVSIGWSPDAVLDTNLGGRLNQWKDLTISPFGGSTFLIAEILYAGLLNSFGVVGALVALVAFLYPVGYAIGRAGQLSVLRRAAAVGCAGYLLAAFFDAAIVYPPVIAIYLFMSALVYRRGFRLPSGDPMTATTGPAR
jgi:hypothetical protein